MTDIPTATSLERGSAKQALYRRFRAQNFSQIVGQDAVCRPFATRSVWGESAMASCSSAPWHRQDLDGTDHGQGGQLHRPARWRTL